MLGWLPENVSTYGAEIDFLFRLIYIITAAIFFGVFITMLVFLFRYRHKAGRQAVYSHGNTTLEIVWTIIPALIVVGLGVKSKASWDHIKREMPASDYHVRVTAKQFNWTMTYPGPDGKFETADDKSIENDLRVPVDRPVRITLAAEDVIHSFFVPVLRLKQDALPGQEIPVWFQATKPGQYEIACAELCGFGHSGMRGLLSVLSQKDYKTWVKEQWPARSKRR